MLRNANTTAIVTNNLHHELLDYDWFHINVWDDGKLKTEVHAPFLFAIERRMLRRL
jgi:hypothetical protein